MITKKNLTALALAVSVSTIATVTAQAQNPEYQAGELILFFQNPGGTSGADQLLFVGLGDTALGFRGTAGGIADAVTQANLINLSDELTAAFGPNWATQTTLRAGLAGVWGNDAVSTDLQNGDPHRTLYASRSRSGVNFATIGMASSTALSISTNGAMTSTASNILGSTNAFAANGTGLTLQIGVDSSTLDENTLPAPATGNADFGGFAGAGLQQAGTATTLGSFGGVDNVEFALDLYRILAADTISGQVGGPLRSGSYEGTFVLNTDGDLSFVGATPVPEPSSALLLAGVIGGAGFLRRRRA